MLLKYLYALNIYRNFVFEVQNQIYISTIITFTSLVVNVKML